MKGKLTYRIGTQTHDFQFKIQQGTYANGQVIINVKTQKQAIGNRFQIHLYAEEGMVLSACEMMVNVPSYQPQSRIFCNGFQSWTQSREWTPDHRIKPINRLTKSLMKAYGDYYFLPEKKSLHSWNYTFIRANGYEDTSIFFMGSVDEKPGYTLLEHQPDKGHCRIVRDAEGLHLKKGQSWLALDIYVAEGEEQAVFKKYFELADTLKSKAKPAVGWTSWYNYYVNVSEKIVLENLNAFVEKKLPIQIFQIDDGWQQAVGDWLIVNHKFPQGMKVLATRIKSDGFTPGLWLAPFMCEKKSDIYKNHKDWLLQNEDGTPRQSGFNVAWKGWSYALDFYNPQVRAYLTKVFDTVLNQWDFDMVKLDFLYCAAMNPPPDKTRGQVMYEVMQWLRATVSDKLILGCGVPLGTSFGLVDYCRIGADVHLTWDIPLIKWLGSRERVSTINSMKNTIFRRHTDGNAFWNDPDVSMLRNRNLKLNAEQRYSLFLVNQIFGSLQFVSDNINEYDAATLHLYKSQFPIKSKVIKEVSLERELYTILFSIGKLTYLAYCNLGNQNATPNLPFAPQQYVFDNRKRAFIQGNAVFPLEPYQSVCLLVVQNEDMPTIAGSTGHLFPGSEIATFTTENEQISITLEKQLVNDTEIFIQLPLTNNVFINGQPHTVSKVNGMNRVVYKMVATA